mmetsp:Transcript_30873/g.81815  ORF Transcript_30873/g.81815 Transcript_30873/m.81815 type:complete len:210 (-) Transcript_30873:12-641(-)
MNVSIPPRTGSARRQRTHQAAAAHATLANARPSSRSADTMSWHATTSRHSRLPRRLGPSLRASPRHRRRSCTTPEGSSTRAAMVRSIITCLWLAMGPTLQAPTSGLSRTAGVRIGERMATRASSVGLEMCAAWRRTPSRPRCNVRHNPTARGRQAYASACGKVKVHGLARLCDRRKSTVLRTVHIYMIGQRMRGAPRQECDTTRRIVEE